VLEPTVSDVVRNLTGGRLADLVDGEFGVVLGVELAPRMSSRRATGDDDRAARHRHAGRHRARLASSV